MARMPERDLLAQLIRPRGTTMVVDCSNFDDKTLGLMLEAYDGKWAIVFTDLLTKRAVFIAELISLPEKETMENLPEWCGEMGKCQHCGQRLSMFGDIYILGKLVLCPNCWVNYKNTLVTEHILAAAAAA